MSGLAPSDLGKFTYLHSQCLANAAAPDEQYAADLVPGYLDILGSGGEAADQLPDAAYSLHQSKYGSEINSALATAMGEIGAGADPATIAERIVRAVAGMRDGRTNGRSDRRLTSELPPLMDAIASGVSMAKPIPTGIAKLDAVMFGWQPTLCLIGADPGVGKSAILVKSAYHGAKNGIKSAFFSLEDPPRFIATRLASNVARVEVLRILYGKLTEAELERVEESLEEIGRYSDNIIVHDGSDQQMAVERLCSVGKSLVASQGVQCIYVDHAGELRSSARDRHDLEVANQLSALRGLANSTGVPVVVAMHMKRRLNAKPSLSDFANSAGAERKARLALALTRDPGAAILQVHILKQTNGPSGVTVDVPFDLQSGTVS